MPCLSSKWFRLKGSRAAAPKGTKSCRTQGESVRPSVRPSIRHSVCLPSVQDALLFKFSLNTMEKWQKAVYGQWYPCPYCIVCRLSWGRSRPGSGSLRPESGSQRQFLGLRGKDFSLWGQDLGLWGLDLGLWGQNLLEVRIWVSKVRIWVSKAWMWVLGARI